MPANTAVPGVARSRPARKSSDGFGTSARPRSVISKTPISSVGPKRFLTARRMRKWWPVSPSNDTTASTMCSTTRGPAIWPSLVTWPTRMTAVPWVLAKRISACALPRTCVTVPGADSTVSVHMVWIESMIASAGGRPWDRVAMMSSTLVSAASSTGAWLKPEPLGAQAHLRDRLLARDVGDAMPRGGQRRGGLHQQRRFADAGVAADQDHRAAHEAAARHAVELGDAGRRARGLVRLAGQPLQREYAALGAGRARRHGPRHRVRRAGLLDNGVPAAAGLALALPAIIDRAAALADEGGVAFGHSYSMPAPRYVRA